MTNYFSKAPIRIPVKLVDGRWEYFYGGGLPIKNGTIGDLLVDKGTIEDKEFFGQLKRSSKHKILGVGTELLVALTVKPEWKLNEKLTAILHSVETPLPLGSAYYSKIHSPYTRFVRLWIGDSSDAQLMIDPSDQGGVWLHIEGTQPKGIVTSRIHLPTGACSTEMADSLNHAFTLLSEQFEPWRKSHTGNIYDRILYKEKNGRWYPLSVLRDAAIAEDEHQLIRDKWIEITKNLSLLNTNKK